MAKVMISLPDDVLWALDAEAERRGTTRSGLLRTLAEGSLRRRTSRRAERMAAITAASCAVGRGGGVADLLRAERHRAGRDGPRRGSAPEQPHRDQP
ncbi:MAG: type II toxin-antitoxin system HicB family antitoxin [Propionibacteriaceae bacterium]|nr:type II toxin-antitoxin system HicB family antitoxin [Propionibacteriaceae bacterium]